MLIYNDYFIIDRSEFIMLHKTKFYVEFMSKKTKHCWVIYKHGSPDPYPVWIYHKHTLQDQCYHLHRKKGSVKAAIKEILQHDNYHLNGRKDVYHNQK